MVGPLWWDRRWCQKAMSKNKGLTVSPWFLDGEMCANLGSRRTDPLSKDIDTVKGPLKNEHPRKTSVLYIKQLWLRR